MTFSASTATRGPSVGVARAAEAVATLALFVWIGGLIALGAFVAPQVFGQLDRERAGQLMGTIFRNFDGLVLACVALFALGESVRNAAGQWRLPWNRARAAVAVFIVGCGLAASAWYSPQIHQLFERGVRRGVGAEGARMGAGVLGTDDCHGDYERLSKMGVEFVQPPKEQPYGIEAVIKDVDGNWFSLTQHHAGGPA